MRMLLPPAGQVTVPGAAEAAPVVGGTQGPDSDRHSLHACGAEINFYSTVDESQVNASHHTGGLPARTTSRRRTAAIPPTSWCACTPSRSGRWPERLVVESAHQAKASDS